METNLQAGVATNRHEFVVKGDDSVFVVFEGEERTPFWRREGDGVRFVFTDLTFARVKAACEQPDSFLDHSIHQTTGDEFLRYHDEAKQKHEEPPKE